MWFMWTDIHHGQRYRMVAYTLLETETEKSLMLTLSEKNMLWERILNKGHKLVIRRLYVGNAICFNGWSLPGIL